MCCDVDSVDNLFVAMVQLRMRQVRDSHNGRFTCFIGISFFNSYVGPA